MLIDTLQIDHIRVNFVSHFNTQPIPTPTSNEILNIADNYPKEMTSQIRQWLHEQQKPRITAPLATVDTSKSVDDFDEYIKEIEENISSYDENENNEMKLKVFFQKIIILNHFFFLQKILQQIAERPNLPQNLTNNDKQRVENLQQRFSHAQKQIEEIRKKNSPTINTDQIIDDVDLLIKHIRDIEERIRANAIQPISDYERLIFDCQVRFIILKQFVKNRICLITSDIRKL